MKRLPLALLILTAFLANLFGCANPGSGPDGGPFDEAPPRIVSMTAPEKAAGSKRTKFSLVFNELIKVDNPTEKIIVSPPQMETPEIKVSGRRISVEILDSIRPNTTYTVDFSDAITDNNEGNPLGQYTYIFSTGAVTDTMEISGKVLDAETLDPVKGILVGLHTSAADTAFTRTPFERVARTDATGAFSIKGVARDKQYHIFALQDMDGDYRFSQRSEMIGFLDKQLTPSAFADVRHDTLWVDSVRYDSIRRIAYTHFLPDDVVVCAFKEERQPRHFLKAQRDVPEWFRTYFTARSKHIPVVKGLNFDERGALLEERNPTHDTITYWLTDTTLLRKDTLRIAYTFEAWDDSLQQTFLKTDTLELAARTTFARRAEAEAKERAKWEKQRERRHKRGDFSDEMPPQVFLPLKVETKSSMNPLENIGLLFEQPLERIDTAAIHLRLKVDTLFHEAPFEIDSVPGQLRARRLRAEWRPGQQYELLIDSAATHSIFGLPNSQMKSTFAIGKLEDYGTLFLTLADADSTAVVQLLSEGGKTLRQVPAPRGQAEFYYLTPGDYYLRCFLDRNGDGRWTPGEWSTRTLPEEVYYYSEKINIRANWDASPTWRLTSLPTDRQKPQALLRQKEEKRANNTRQRNIERRRERGE